MSLDFLPPPDISFRCGRLLHLEHDLKCPLMNHGVLTKSSRTLCRDLLNTH